MQKRHYMLWWIALSSSKRHLRFFKVKCPGFFQIFLGFNVVKKIFSLVFLRSLNLTAFRRKISAIAYYLRQPTTSHYAKTSREIFSKGFNNIGDGLIVSWCGNNYRRFSLIKCGSSPFGGDNRKHQRSFTRSRRSVNSEHIPLLLSQIMAQGIALRHCQRKLIAGMPQTFAEHSILSEKWL